MTSTLAQTPLHAWHASHGGRMVDFAGWSMPVQYASITSEHLATRAAVGLFDVSHMGRLRLEGAGAETFLDGLLTRRVAGMPAGAVRYSLVTNDTGGILDDVLVYHLHPAQGPPYYELVVNAGNRERIVEWLDAHRGQAALEIVDTTPDTAMIAVQGPRALDLVKPLASVDPAGLSYYHAAECRILGQTAIVSRTGYTGEDGCELIVSEETAAPLWQALWQAAVAVGGMAAGLGARDTLRLEAGMPLYGHELDLDISPFQAGLAFAVQWKDRAFPGRDALVRLRGDERLPVRAGWRLSGKRVAREGSAVLVDGGPRGRVTSGTFSPTLGAPIAMGYVSQECAVPGREVSIEVRGHHEAAVCVALPFYRRTPRPFA